MMKHLIALLAVVVACAMLVPRLAAAEVSGDTLKSISRPDKVETGLGTLEFKDGAERGYGAKGVRRSAKRVADRPLDANSGSYFAFASRVVLVPV